MKIVVESSDSPWTIIATIATLLAVVAALAIAVYDKKARDRDAKQRFAIERLLQLSDLVAVRPPRPVRGPETERIHAVLMLLEPTEASLVRHAISVSTPESDAVLIKRLKLKDDDLVLLNLGYTGDLFQPVDMQQEIAGNIQARLRG